MTNKIEYGSVAYNELLALTFANIIVGLVLALVSVSFVGTILIAVLALIDAILYLICQIANQSEDSFLCTGILQSITEAIAKTIYQTDPAIDFDNDNRLKFQTDGFVLSDPAAGFVVGNPVYLTQTITNTLYMDDHILQPNRLLLKKDVERAIRDSAFGYSIQVGNNSSLHESLSLGTQSWSDPAGDAVAQRQFVVAGTLNYPSGVNATASFLTLSEGFQTKRADCWWTWISSAYICNMIPYGDTVHSEIGRNFALDIFPATFDQFTTLLKRPNNNNGVTLRYMPGMPLQPDADGDRLRSIAFGGNDPRRQHLGH